jgi:hypothetical protein
MAFVGAEMAYDLFRIGARSGCKNCYITHILIFTKTIKMKLIVFGRPLKVKN